MHNFRQLKVWQKARELNKDIYLLSNSFPADERFGITSQIRRSAISIVSNIAEGTSRKSEKDFTRFLRIALGSAFELETQLILSIDLDYLAVDNSDSLILRVQEIQKMLIGLEKKIS